MDAKTTPTKPAAKAAKLVFTPGVCRHRVMKRDKIVLDCTEPVAHKTANLCKKHQAEWQKGAKLTAAGRAKFLALAEERKLDPTLREKSPAKVASKPAKKTGTKPAQVAKIPARSVAASLPEATVTKVSA